MSAHIELGRRFRELKDKHDAIKAQLDEVSKEWHDCETQLQDAMVEEGLKSFSIDGVGQLQLRTKNYLSVNADNKPKCYKYLETSGNAALLKLEVNPKTLGAFLDRHLEELMAKYQALGADFVDSRELALKFLQESAGVAHFTKRDIALRKE